MAHTFLRGPQSLGELYETLVSEIEDANDHAALQQVIAELAGDIGRQQDEPIPFHYQLIEVFERLIDRHGDDEQTREVVVSILPTIDNLVGAIKHLGERPILDARLVKLFDATMTKSMNDFPIDIIKACCKVSCTVRAESPLQRPAHQWLVIGLDRSTRDGIETRDGLTDHLAAAAGILCKHYPAFYGESSAMVTLTNYYQKTSDTLDPEDWELGLLFDGNTAISSPAGSRLANAAKDHFARRYTQIKRNPKNLPRLRKIIAGYASLKEDIAPHNQQFLDYIVGRKRQLSDLTKKLKQAAKEAVSRKPKRKAQRPANISTRRPKPKMPRG